MGAKLAYRRNISICTSLSIISAWLLAIMVWPGLAAEEHGRTHDTVDIRMRVVDEEGKPLTGIPIGCMDSEQKIIREAMSDEKGKYTLNVSRAFQTIECKVERWDGSPETKKIRLERDTDVVFTRNSGTIKTLPGWITSRTGGSLPHVLVQVTQNGTTFSRRANEDGKVEFANLRVGPAHVRYIAAGHEGPEDNAEDGKKGCPVDLVIGDGKVELASLQVGPAHVRYIAASYVGAGGNEKDSKGWCPIYLREGSDLSASLWARWDETGLVLLVPGILILVLILSLLAWNSRQWHSGLNPWLILASLLSWGGVFLWLGLLFKSIDGEDLFFFHPRLAFSLSIPVFGFLGALIWGLGLFRTGQPNSDDSRDFVLRLVLGPYVAIVMVLLFKDVFVWFPPDLGASFQSQQATVAFLSGFLVTRVLQSLTEKGSGLCKYTSSVRGTAPPPQPSQASPGA